MKLSKKEMEDVKKDKKELKELNNWMHRLQQNVQSLEKRLDAIERRLSNEDFEGTHLALIEGNEKDKETKDIENLIKRLNLLEKEINELKKNEKRSTPTISIRKGEKNYDNEILNIERRLEKLERKKATVKVGKIEVPIEITGLVGGLLAFLIAILLLEGYKKVVISPPFVGFIGLVLLLATGIKTYIINATKNDMEK